MPYMNYWRPEIYRDNQRAFNRPSDRTVGRLRDRYGVSWLFVDKRFRADLDGLRAVADLRYERGDYAVFRIPPA